MPGPQSPTGLGGSLDLFLFLPTVATLINLPFLPFTINLALLIGWLRTGGQNRLSLGLCLSLSSYCLAFWSDILTTATISLLGDSVLQWSSPDSWLFCLTCLKLNKQQSSPFILTISNGSYFGQTAFITKVFSTKWKTQNNTRNLPWEQSFDLFDGNLGLAWC